MPALFADKPAWATSTGREESSVLVIQDFDLWSNPSPAMFSPTTTSATFCGNQPPTEE